MWTNFNAVTKGYVADTDTCNLQNSVFSRGIYKKYSISVDLSRSTATCGPTEGYRNTWGLDNRQKIITVFAR